MKYAIAGLAMLCASQAHAFDTGIPIMDFYSGGPPLQCFKFWLAPDPKIPGSGSNDQYAINADTTAHLNLINEIRAAGYNKKTVSLGFWSDALLPLQNVFPRMVACASGDGMSLKFFETPINVSVLP
jgi:hypothetical protein